MSDIKLEEKDISTPRRNGAGDGIVKQTQSSRKRVPVPSSRKFTPKIQRNNEGLRLKLQDALEDVEDKQLKRHCCLQKSLSVAEITPTKSKKRRSITAGDAAATTTVTLHATPRPFADASRRQRCPMDRAECLVYRRLLLYVWRRARGRLASAVESCGRHKEQMLQMEMQVNVLKQLRNSECDKRNEALNECQKIKKKVEELELENSQLTEDNKKCQRSLEISHRDLKSTKTEVKIMADQMMKIQELLKRKRELKRALEDRISDQQNEITVQTSRVQELEESLKITQNNLYNSESDLKLKEEAYDELLLQLKKEVEQNYSLNRELNILKEFKKRATQRIQNLETELDEYMESYEEIKHENEDLKNDVTNITLTLDEEKRKSWYKNTKEFALLSLSALQKIAYIMLPAYLDVPEM